MCSSGTARLRRLASGLAVWFAVPVLVALGTGDARADCALIDSATRPLQSTYGAIAQPYGSPTREVKIFNPVKCNPDASNFAFAPPLDDAHKAKNKVTISWIPRNVSAPAPDPMELTIDDFDLDDCNEQNTRCTTIRITIPDTTGVVSNGVTGPFTGPASIVVQNLNVSDDPGTPGVDESISAQIDDVFEPTTSCNSLNRSPNLFRHFSILPPDNLFLPGPGRSAVVTADGGDGVLVPMNWSPALPGSSSGEAQFSIVHVQATSLFVGPGDVRAFTTDTGQPLPPILEINQAGDAVTGSIDFPFSVTRLNLPFLAALAPAVPFVLPNLTYEALAAGPLNSITPTDQLVGLARDETLEGDLDGDGNADSRFVSFIDKVAGGVIDTGQKVMESSRSPLKAVLEGNGDLLAFCQSEAHEREKISGDNDLEDCIARLFDGSGTDLSENLIATADPTANFNGPNAFGVGPNYAFFLRNELHEASYELVHASADAAGQFLDPPAGSSTHPSLAGDVVYFTSDAGAALAPVLPPSGDSLLW